MNVVHKLVHLNKFMNLEGSGSVFKYKNTATLRLLPPVLINPPGALPAGASIPLHHRPLSLIFKIRVRHPQLLHKQERVLAGLRTLYNAIIFYCFCNVIFLLQRRGLWGCLDSFQALRRCWEASKTKISLVVKNHPRVFALPVSFMRWGGRGGVGG